MDKTIKAVINACRKRFFGYVKQEEKNEKKFAEQDNCAKTGMADVHRFSGNVLVCEDNETCRQVIQLHLNKVGLNVAFAENGKQGVELAMFWQQRKHPFDLIFMDIHMPVLDGLTAAKTLFKSGVKTPIIALTANITDFEIIECRKSGIETYLDKPFKTWELNDCLLKYLTPLEKGHPERVQFDVFYMECASEQYDGDETAYRNILEVFAKNNKKTVERLKNAVYSNDLNLAYRVIHSIKGAAGAIGALALSEAALDVEKALTFKEPPDIDELSATMECFEKEYGILYNRLDSMVMQNNNAAKAESVEREDILGLIEKLLPLLKTGDAKCLELLEEARALFLASAEKYERLITQMEHCDFDLAYETLTDIYQFMK